MKHVSSLVMWAQRACIARAISANLIAAFTICCLLCLSSNGMCLFGQSYRSVDWLEFKHGLLVPSGYQMQGDTVHYAVWLGTATVPATNVLGCEVRLTVSDHAVVPATAQCSVNNSWCFEAANLSADIGNAPHLRIALHATDSSWQSGHGSIFSFALIATRDSVQAADLISDIEGLVIVENIDAKSAGTIAHNLATKVPIHDQIGIGSVVELHSFPNPTQGVLYLPFVLTTEMQWQVFSAEGNAVASQIVAQYGTCMLDLMALPAGLYTMQIVCKNAQMWRERILKR